MVARIRIKLVRLTSIFPFIAACFLFSGTFSTSGDRPGWRHNAAASQQGPTTTHVRNALLTTRVPDVVSPQQMPGKIKSVKPGKDEEVKPRTANTFDKDNAAKESTFKAGSGLPVGHPLYEKNESQLTGLHDTKVPVPAGAALTKKSGQDFKKLTTQWSAKDSLIVKVPNPRNELQVSSSEKDKKIQSNIIVSKHPIEIHVKVMTDHFFGEDYDRMEPCNTVESPPRALHCEYKPDLPTDNADALWYFAPMVDDGQLEPTRQPKVVHSTEPASYYPSLNSPKFMNQFAYTMLYRRNSSVPLTYVPFDIRTETSARAATPLPGFATRKASVSFVNGNCDDVSGRRALVEALMAMGVPVEAAGACLHNVDGSMRADKDAEFRGHRVCVGIENSVESDYVTEKVWDAYRTGCVPIYLGAPNFIEDFAPAPDSVILADKYDAQGLADEIKRVLTDAATFNRYTAWRRRPFAELSSGYKKTLELHYGVSSRCALCRLLLEKKEKEVREVTPMTCLKP
ncbi:hypothetical protein BC830DRAFT_192415 [Chytriomyces sp. MP71]|nr:hypothetical protein BC830DRAFT_192415 [Chytriomyces sp. MP71]